MTMSVGNTKTPTYVRATSVWTSTQTMKNMKTGKVIKRRKFNLYTIGTKYTTNEKGN